MMKISRVFFRLEKGMLSLQQRHRFSVHLAVAASGAVIFLFLVVVPVTRQNALLNGRIAGQRRLLFRYEQLLQKREMIRREYRAIFESSAQKTQTDPSVSVLKALEELAGQAGVKILNIRQTRVAAHDKFREVLVSLTAEGRKDQYVKFFYTLRDPASLFVIKECNLRNDRDTGLLRSRFVIAYSMADG